MSETLLKQSIIQGKRYYCIVRTVTTERGYYCLGAMKIQIKSAARAQRIIEKTYPQKEGEHESEYSDPFVIIASCY